jgi:hypothetical protein
MTETSSAAGLPRPAWNKGKITGPKPPLRPSHVWAIRAKLDLEKRTRDLAMFNLAIDSKLRGCDLVALRVDDVAPNGYAKDRANIRQRKTGRPVRFELTEPTREALDNYLRGTNRKAGEYLFPGGRNSDRPLSTRQYARLVSKWVRVSSIAHFDGHFREANEGGQVDLILDRPVPHEDAVVLAPVNDKACGGAAAPSLTAAARAGAEFGRAGRRDGRTLIEPRDI